MPEVRNILFIMADQLRADYLGCYGHPSLQTPNIDALAGRGVRFQRAYCNAPICGPSRMSFYTGRSMASHGCAYNRVPIRVDEWTLSDYLRAEGLRSALVGKTHFGANPTDIDRLHLSTGGQPGAYVLQCGFEPYERDDGLHPMGSFDPNLRPSLWPSEKVMIETLNALAAEADIVMPGLSEGRLLTGRETAYDIAGDYLDRGAKVVVIKLGPEGSYFRTADSEGTVEGSPVKQVIDTVGAGDGFGGALCYGLLQNWPLKRVIRFANIAGAIVATRRECSTAMPTSDEVEAVLAEVSHVSV